MILEDWVVSLFVEMLVGMDSDKGDMLRDGDGLYLDMIKLSYEKVLS